MIHKCYDRLCIIMENEKVIENNYYGRLVSTANIKAPELYSVLLRTILPQYSFNTEYSYCYSSAFVNYPCFIEIEIVYLRDYSMNWTHDKTLVYIQFTYVGLLINTHLVTYIRYIFGKWDTIQ